jgi:hypothetical protein
MPISVEKYSVAMKRRMLCNKGSDAPNHSLVKRLSQNLIHKLLLLLLLVSTVSGISVASAPMASAAQSSECVIGSSALCAATSPQEIYNLYGTTTNGTYWIKVNGTATEVYVMMDRTNSDNGSWVLMMKGAPASTNFLYNSTYWTNSSTTLNTTSLTNDVATDAKFSVFNDLSVKKMLAVFKPGTSSGSYPYDAGTYGIPVGGDIANNPFGGHVWLETLTAASTAQSRLTNTNILFNTAASIPVTKYKQSAAAGANRVFSYQNPMGHYGFNITSCSAGGSSLRWGFQWNENGVTDYGSCDMWGGIGGGWTSANDSVIWNGAGCEAVCAAPGTSMGHKNLSFQIWGKVAEPSLGAPTGLTATPAGSGQMSLSWGAPAAVSPTDYIVQYKTAAATNYTNSFIVSSQTTASISGLLSATQYNFRVFARTASDSTSSANVSSSTVSAISSLPVPTTTNVSTSPSVVYGASNTLTATVSPETATGTVNFKNGGSSILGCSAAVITTGVATCTTWKPSVGSYSITASYSGNSGLAESTSEAASLQVTKAPLNVIPDGKSTLFGAVAPVYSFTYQGFVNGDSATSSSFLTGLTPPVCTSTAYSSTTTVAQSPLQITCSGGFSSNYQFDTVATSNLIISRASPVINLSIASAAPMYGAIDTITATTSVAGSVSFKSSGADISGCTDVATTGSSTFIAQCLWIPSGVATYSLTAGFSPTDSVNYETVTALALTPTSTKAAITVTPTAGQSKVYGANDPTLAYTITSGSLVGSDVLSGSLTYTGTNVGNYAIAIGTLANPNYNITLAPVTFGITKATQSAVGLSSLSASYSSNNKSVTLTGTGGSGPNSYSYALDPGNTTPGCSVSGTTLTYSTAGTCIVTVTNAESGNYFAQTNSVSFSIGLASQTISFGSLSARSYSSETFTVSAISSVSLSVVFSSGSPSVCTTAGNNGSVITLLGVGTCVINANQAGDANTGAASQVSQNFTVNPRAITVTADAKSKSLGASDPALTYSVTVSSLVLGDALTGALSRAPGVDAGAYQIQQGTLTTANNPKYDITFVTANLEIARATPSLVLSYPNSNVAILRPGATDTPTATSSSSAGALTFATTAASSICTVDSTSGVISLFGAGSCPISMTTAQTTNYIQLSETTTVTIALLSTSLVGIDSSDLISMGQPFYAHPIIDQSYSFSSGSNGASVSIPAGALDATVPISIHLLTDSADQRAMIEGTGASVLSVVVSWVAVDGSVPNTNTGKAISVTLTNPAIKRDAKVYSIIGNQSRLLGTATADGSITTQITEDPVLLVINPVINNTPPPSGGGGGYVAPVQIESTVALTAAKELADKKAAEEAAAEALKVTQEKMAADAKALAEATSAQAAAAVKAAQDATEALAKEAAALQAAKDAANAAVKIEKPSVTLYSLSPSLKLSAYDSAYLTKHVKSLKNGASVTCIGYTYGKSPASKASQDLAKRQATAVCAQMKKINKSLKTSIVIYPATKAPKAAVGAKWVGVSYRIDGFKK